MYLMKIQTALTFCISACIFIFSPITVELLFGSEYRRSASILRIMSLLPLIIGLNNIFGIQVFLSHGYKKEFSVILMSSGLISLLTLIPLCYFLDAEGAAISVVITDSIVTLLMLYTIRKKSLYLNTNLNV
jgi:PST family polysaccharide transporter